MTWVLLELQFNEEEITEKQISQSHYEFDVKKGEAPYKLVFYNTLNAKVSEVTYNIVSGQLVERQPTGGEVDSVTAIKQGFAGADPVASAKIRKQEQFIRDYKKQVAAGQRRESDLEAQIRVMKITLDARREGKPKQIPQQNNSDISVDQWDLVISALEYRLKELVRTQQWVAHARTAAIYTKLSGLPAPSAEEDFLPELSEEELEGLDE